MRITTGNDGRNTYTIYVSERKKVVSTTASRFLPARKEVVLYLYIFSFLFFLNNDLFRARITRTCT